MTDKQCELCRASASALSGQNPRFVHEFESSILLVGGHQLFPGYCLLVSKQHVREPFELPEKTQEQMFRELMKSAQALQKAFRPWKINYSCYGNQVPHIHWHLFPRLESDPLHLQTPWAQAAEFDHHSTTPEQAREVVAKLRGALH